MADAQQPIIIKKIKKGGHGHHGGAWKVAYADFVTAMMAFFLLLWLLNVTTKEQKQGISDYFTPTMGIKDEKGIGIQGGNSPVEGTSKTELAPPGIVFGAPMTGDAGQIQQNTGGKPEDVESEENESFNRAEKELKEAFNTDPALKELKNHVIIDNTPEGLRIQIVDQKDRAMFKVGSFTLEQHTKLILAKISEVAGKMPNKLSIGGHTDSLGYGAGASYTNWELSSDRANSTRRFMLGQGIPETKFARVQGKADREQLDDDPSSPRNRRVSIILLKNSASPHDLAAPAELLSTPKASDNAPNLNLKPKTLGEDPNEPQ